MRILNALIVAGIALFVSACADKTITLRYDPPALAQVAGPKLTVVQFIDHRGSEGDQGDPYRVGGIYGGYGNRLAKLMASKPWPAQLMTALVAEFRAQGVDAVLADHLPVTKDQEGFVLEGETRNFSTESRWGREAHISANLRLLSPQRRVLVEKKIEVRETGYHWNNFNVEILEELMNRAFARFVRAVTTDSEIRALLR